MEEGVDGGGRDGWREGWKEGEMEEGGKGKQTERARKILRNKRIDMGRLRPSSTWQYRPILMQ